MERDEFYGEVQRRASLADRADATDATQAVLSTLGERLSEDQSHDLAAELPEAIADHLTDGASGRRFPYEEFLARIDQRADRADRGEPDSLARAVLETLLDGVSAGERAAVVDQLDHYGWDDLLADVDVETGA